MKLAAFAAVVLVAGAGCLSEAADAPVPEPEKSSRRSVGGSADNETEYMVVDFFETAVSLVGQDSAAFDVTVPANVTAVSYHLNWDTAAQLFGLRVELSGCGAYDQGMGSYTSGGGGGMSSSLCGQGTPGAQSVTIDNTGYVDGTLSLRAKIPKLNETAAP